MGKMCVPDIKNLGFSSTLKIVSMATRLHNLPELYIML